jgi:hypothetical protein
MSYYKSGIGKTPFFTKNRSIRIEHSNCEQIKKRLESVDIKAIVREIPIGCSIITNASYLEVVNEFRDEFR